jgi:hypothetical protein
MLKHIIATSPEGHDIYVDLISSRAGHYLSRRPYVVALIKEALADQKLTESESPICIVRDMGRIIGKSDVVKTSDKDTIFYAQPNKIEVFSRYVKNLYPSPSRKITIILERDKDGNYEVRDTWIGAYSPPFPGDQRATAESKAYWRTHALVLDSQVIQSKTITKTWPYESET